MKFNKKLLGYLTSPFVIGLLVTFAITYVASVYYANRHKITGKNDTSFTALIQMIHEKTIDFRLVDRGPRAGSDRVAILAIDDNSIDLEGRWPWTREKQAKLVEKTLDYGAKIIGFDIAYAEEETNAAAPALDRVRRMLASTDKLSSDMGSLIESEKRRADADQYFANTIRKHSDRLVLGSFFNDEFGPRGHKEFCTDAIFERTHESRYWKRDAAPLAVKDDLLAKVAFPRPIKDNLAQHFMFLEVKRSQHWFSKAKGVDAKITESLGEIAGFLPAETYPGLATLMLNDDVDSMKSLLEAVKPDLATPDGARAVFARVKRALDHNERASLLSAVRKELFDYCDRFFSSNDELLNETAFKDKHGDTPELAEQFKNSSWASIWPQIQGVNPDLGKEPLDKAIERYISLSLPNVIVQASTWNVNIPLLADVTKFTGYFNAVQDTDGSVRRSRLLMRFGSSYMPSLALKMFLVDRGYRAHVNVDVDEKSSAKTPNKIVKSFDIQTADGQQVMSIPVDGKGHLMINYAGPQNMFPYIRAADLLSDEPTMNVRHRKLDPKTGRWHVANGGEGEMVDKKEFLKDKLLIAGATALAVFDLRVTPFDENYPGVETHANVLSNLLVEDANRAIQAREPASLARVGGPPGFMRVHPAEEHVMWIVLLGLGIVMSALLTYFGSVSGLGITTGVLAGIYFVDRMVIFKQGITVATLFPTFTVIANYVSLTFYKYFTEERKKRELKGTFEKYVSPSIVAEVLSDPSNIELGGKKMDLTVMFSDVRGFTTICERLDPRQVSDLLNSYLTPMTALVFKHKGTLNKYMGDAIMAFWGAPIHFEDHAKHACRCALQMIDKLHELQAQYKAQGLPPIDIGIGLNTGDMSVGNMGSETVRSYTIMGDSVNLGSRLEGINKEYGTRIIISEFTQARVADSFVTREVDWVKVKGKTQPVRIFELIAEGQVASEKQAMLKHFARGFELYHERKFQEAIDVLKEALKIEPDDAVSQLYVERCQDYLKEPPPEQWDGVFTMTTK